MHEKTARIRNQKLKLSRAEVIERFKKVHGNKYNYDQIDPNGILNTVEIKCKNVAYLSKR